MKKKMIKVLWIFLIFALTSNTKGFTSAIDLSLFIALFPISDCHSVPDTESRLQSREYYSPTQNIFSVIHRKITGTKGRYDYSVISTNVGIQSDSPLTRGAKYPSGAGVECVFSFHPAKKLSTPGSAIAGAGSSPLTLKCVSVDSIQITQVSSNNLSDIFIPPK